MQETNLDIIDNSSPDTFFKGRIIPVLNINWDLEKPTETGLVSYDSSNGGGSVSNLLVKGSFRRSEIDNIIGRNTSVFISNVTNNLFDNTLNAANQISSQFPQPLLIRKRLIKLVDIWNRVLIGMNIPARDNGSMNRLFGANIQTNADVLFRNQQTVVDNKVTYNEFNSWNWLTRSDPSFIFSQVSRFLYACIFELKEKLKEIDRIINESEDFDNIIPDILTKEYTNEHSEILLNGPVFDKLKKFNNDYITSLTNFTCPLFNWTVTPTSATSKFQHLGAFSKCIPQSYSILLLEPNFLLLLQELIDIIMDLVEEDHFLEIFSKFGIAPKDLKLIKILDSETKNLDNLVLNGINNQGLDKSITSNCNFSKVNQFYKKYLNDYEFLNGIKNNLDTTNKNTQTIINYKNDFKVWGKLQKDSFNNLDMLIEIFEYCSDLTSSIRYRAQWDTDKILQKFGYDVGNRVDKITPINTSKLSTYLGEKYFESLDNFIELNSTKRPKPFFKAKNFSVEVFTGVTESKLSPKLHRDWKFGLTIVKFPQEFEVNPNHKVLGEKYRPCSWIKSNTNEILMQRSYIDVTDQNDEMYFAFYNASTSFGVSSHLEDLFRKMYPIYTSLEVLHGQTLCQINTLKTQLVLNTFKIQFIGDNQEKYFTEETLTPDSSNDSNAFNGIIKKTITEADIFINIKADDDNKDNPNEEETLLKPTDKLGRTMPHIDTLKNFKIFYRLN